MKTVSPERLNSSGSDTERGEELGSKPILSDSVAHALYHQAMLRKDLVLLDLPFQHSPDAPKLPGLSGVSSFLPQNHRAWKLWPKLVCLLPSTSPLLDAYLYFFKI